MLLIAGVDPGLTGAIAIFDYDSDKLFGVWDIPTVKEKIGAVERRRLDMPALRVLFEMAAMLGVKMIGIEKVQGWGGKGQSASAAFQFGYVFAKIESEAQIVADVETARPDVWKLREKVPTDEKGIVKLAIAEFPDLADRFVGPRGGSYHDRAEAAFIARYFARRIWPMRAPSPMIIDGHEVRDGDRIVVDEMLAPGQTSIKLAAPTAVTFIAGPKPPKKPRKAKPKKK